MTGVRVCATNLVPDLRSCTVRGAHTDACTGRARRWNPDTGRIEQTDAVCTGCVPREAEPGTWMCYSHLTKFDHALDDVVELVRLMWTENSNGIRDTNEGGGGGSSAPAWTMLESRTMSSWIIASARNALDVLYGVPDVNLTYLDGRRGIPTDATARTVHRKVWRLAEELRTRRDDLIGTVRGAEAAIRFTAVVQAAYRKFPLVEAEHRIVGIRCPVCQEARLVWTPPLMQRGDVVIRCEECGNTEPQSWIEQYSAIAQMRPIRAAR